MTFASRTQFHVERPWDQRPFSIPFDTHVEREPDLFTEDDNEPVESSEEEEDDDEAIRHDLVTSLHRPVVLLQLLGSDVDVVFTSIVR